MFHQSRWISPLAIALSTAFLIMGCSSAGDSNNQDSTTASATTRPGVTAEAPTVQAAEPQLPLSFTGDEGVEIEVTSLDRVLVMDDGTMEVMDALGMSDTIGIAPDESLVEDIASEADERMTTGGGAVTVEGIAALNPTVVIGTSMRRHADLVSGLQDIDIPATLIDDSQPATGKIRKTASVLGVTAAGEELANLVQEQLDTAARKLKGTDERPRVMVLSSSGAGDTGATTAAGKQTPAHQVIVSAGGLNTGAETGLDRYQSITAEGLIAAAPEIIVVAKSEIDDLGGKDGIWENVSGLAETRAAESHMLYVLDDMQLKGGGVSSGVGISNLMHFLHPNL